jgi:predicted RNA-binding Zn-ribbon protein involved in translation (DUF1610 family)
MYNCKKCNRGFDRKIDYERHAKTKCDSNAKRDLVTIEKRPGDFQCPKCGNDFAHKSNLQRHIKTALMCQLKAKAESNVLALIKEDVVLPKAPIVGNNIPVNISNNINNIPPVMFVKHGQENMDHITKNVVLALLANDNFNVICAMLMNSAYFEKTVPENHNWCLIYPNNDQGAVVHDEETDEMKRESSAKIIHGKFINMMNLLKPTIIELINENEDHPFLTEIELINLRRLHSFCGIDELSKDSKGMYEEIKKVAFKHKQIVYDTWKKLGYKGNHLSIKF